MGATSRISSADLGKRAGWTEQCGGYQQLGFAHFLLLHDGLLRARRRHRSRDPPHLINEKMRMRVPMPSGGNGHVYEIDSPASQGILSG
jgi:hypothetical protein